MLDRISGQRKTENLGSVYESDLPPQYSALIKLKKEEKQRQDRSEREAAEQARDKAAEEEARKREEARIQGQAERKADEQARKAAVAEESRTQDEAREKESAAATKLFDLNALTKRADAQKGETLVFKKFYLGMPITDGLQLINNTMGLKQTLPTPIKEKSETMLFSNDKSYRIYSPEGKSFIAKSSTDTPFAVADASGLIDSFQLSPEVLNKLFNSENMPKKEFLQLFMENYGIPKLEPETVKITFMLKEYGYQNILRYRDPKGYEVIYHDGIIAESAIQALIAGAKPEGTMTISKIKTEKEREKKFD